MHQPGQDDYVWGVFQSGCRPLRLSDGSCHERACGVIIITVGQFFSTQGGGDRNQCSDARVGTNGFCHYSLQRHSLPIWTWAFGSAGAEDSRLQITAAHQTHGWQLQLLDS